MVRIGRHEPQRQFKPIKGLADVGAVRARQAGQFQFVLLGRWWRLGPEDEIQREKLVQQRQGVQPVTGGGHLTVGRWWRSWEGEYQWVQLSLSDSLHRPGNVLILRLAFQIVILFTWQSYFQP